MTSLANDSSYDFMVAATNSTGTGPWSSVMQATPVGPKKPGAPTITTVTRHGSQIEVTWTAALANGSPISEYLCEYKSPTGNFASCSATTLGTLLTVHMTGMTPGSDYEFRVAAINGMGTGPWSAIVSTVPLNAPGAPTNLTASAGDKQVVLNWTPAITGDPAATYTVTGSHGATCTVTDPITTCTITGLTNNWYEFRVTAVNGIGSSTPSVVLTAKGGT